VWNVSHNSARYSKNTTLGGSKQHFRPSSSNRYTEDLIYIYHNIHSCTLSYLPFPTSTSCLTPPSERATHKVIESIVQLRSKTFSRQQSANLHAALDSIPQIANLPDLKFLISELFALIALRRCLPTGLIHQLLCQTS
jgi:hypothetical protein